MPLHQQAINQVIENETDNPLDINPKPELINFEDVKKAALVIRALNNPLRKQLIEFLLRNERATVTDLVFDLREEQTLIYQHLSILRQTKIVTFLKNRKNVYYFLNRSRVEEIQKCISNLFEEKPSGDGLKKI